MLDYLRPDDPVQEDLVLRSLRFKLIEFVTDFLQPHRNGTGVEMEQHRHHGNGTSYMSPL